MTSTKQSVIDLIQRLPEDCTLEDIQYQLYVRQKIQKSLDAAGEGRIKSHAQVKKRLARWLTK